MSIIVESEARKAVASVCRRRGGNKMSSIVDKTNGSPNYEEKTHQEFNVNWLIIPSHDSRRVARILKWGGGGSRF